MNAISIRNKNYLLKKNGFGFKWMSLTSVTKTTWTKKNEFGFVMNIINIRQQKLPSF